MDVNGTLRGLAYENDCTNFKGNAGLPYINAYIRIYSVFYPKFNQALMDELMVEFEIDRSKKLNTLSYGQKKKFMIAFAIATECSIIVMDEPTNGLDIPSKNALKFDLQGQVIILMNI